MGLTRGILVSGNMVVSDDAMDRKARGMAAAVWVAGFTVDLTAISSTRQLSTTWDHGGVDSRSGLR